MIPVYPGVTEEIWRTSAEKEIRLACGWTSGSYS